MQEILKMEMKSTVDLYNELNKKDVSTFMIETAEYFNKLVKDQGSLPLFKINYDTETVTNISDVVVRKEFGHHHGEKERIYDCNNIDDSLNMISFLSAFDYDEYRYPESILDNSKIPTNECFLYIDNELYITNDPEYVLYNYINDNFVVHYNAIFNVEKNGKLSLNRIFNSIPECNEFIFDYCQDKNIISFGTNDPAMMKQYFNNLIESATCDDMDQDDIDFVNHLKIQLNKLDDYTLNKQQNISKSK